MVDDVLAQMDDIVEFWRHYDEMEVRLTRPVSERMLEFAGVSPGMHVLDVACGRGEPAIPAAHRVEPHGRVLAIDNTEGLLQIARERATREGLRNVEFRVADAETLEIDGEVFDVATVRWALMYMHRPERALESIHRALKPEGTLVIASWAEPEYTLLPRRVLSRYRDVPPVDSSSPGVFRHAAPSVLDASLQRCGFELAASVEMNIPVVEAPDADGIVTWLREMRLIGELPADQQRTYEADLRKELERSRIGDRVTLGGVTRITVAHRR